MTRLQRLQQRLEQPLLVSDGVNVFYLTGFRSSNAALLVEQQRVRLFSDFRYAEAGRKVPDVEFVQTKRNLYVSLVELLKGTVAFEARALAYDRYETLRGGGLELVPTRGEVEALRAVKDEGELAAIRAAAELTNEVLATIAREPWLGRTEREIALRIEELYRELGAEKPAFETAVAAGANGALPHGKPGDRAIEDGQTIVVDTGCVVDGYASDCTRTFAAGGLSGDLAHAYDVCLRAQETGLAACRAGRGGADVDRDARAVIDAEGFGAAFGHGLGHGLGLEVHEAPYLNQESSDTLAAGNVVTVEPGIYLPGVGGIRIEDLVVVTDDGVEVLTSFPKELVTVR
jgi:Xaa-Pro aminopeptidase